MEKLQSLLILILVLACWICMSCTPAAVGLMPPPSSTENLDEQPSMEFKSTQAMDIQATELLTQTLDVEEAISIQVAEPTEEVSAAATPEPTIMVATILKPTIMAATILEPPVLEPEDTPASPVPAVEITPTLVVQAADCNRAELIEDVTVIDGMVIPGGESFLKVWRVRNSGSCSWTTGYALVFSSGEQMSGPDEVSLTREVPPGDSVDLLVEMTAPATPGSYEGDWMLRSADGQLFGGGQSGDLPLRIRLYIEAENPIAYDFGRNFCAARWSSQAAAEMECPSPGIPGDAGWVGIDLLPILEGGRIENEPALILSPSPGDGGYVSGFYPALRIETGDRFKAVIGCLHEFSACRVVFQLNYYTLTNSTVRSLGSWRETYDGEIAHLDIGLGALTGQDVIFQLLVLSEGNSEEDRAFWLCPHVER